MNEKLIILANTILICFVMNDNDEIIPNENWYKLEENKKEKIREVLKNNGI